MIVFQYVNSDADPDRDTDAVACFSCSHRAVCFNSESIISLVHVETSDLT